jgi:hypothetical protein
MRFLLLLSVAIFFSACQNSQNTNDFFSDKASSVNCPGGICANSTASVNNLSIAYLGPRPLATSTSEETVQIGGDCYPSLYPKNRINVVVRINGNGNPVYGLPASEILPVGDSVLRCIGGRYNFVLKTVNLPANSYLIELEQIGIDASGVEQRNTANGGSKVSIQINRFQAG